MKNRPLAIDTHYPPFDSVERDFNPALDSVERTFTAEDLGAFYAAEKRHASAAHVWRLVLATLAGILLFFGFFCGVALCWYYGPRLYVECQRLREVFGSLLR